MYTTTGWAEICAGGEEPTGDGRSSQLLRATCRERQRDKERRRETERETERDGERRRDERETERDGERRRETERDGERGTNKETETDRQRDRQRDRERTWRTSGRVLGNAFFARSMAVPAPQYSSASHSLASARFAAGIVYLENQGHEMSAEDASCSETSERTSEFMNT
jgi:hypothetical protein